LNHEKLFTDEKEKLEVKLMKNFNKEETDGRNNGGF
jgi:hypothetical protein